MNTWIYDIPNWYPTQGETFLANGYFGGMVPCDGHGASGQRHATALAGFYAGEEEQAVCLPHWLHAPLEVDGSPVEISPVNYRQCLHLRHGTMTTRYRDKAGRIRVEVEVLCHRRHRNLGYYTIRIEAQADLHVKLSPQLALLPPDKQRGPKPQPIVKADVCGWDFTGERPEESAAQRLCVLSQANANSLRQPNAVGRVLDVKLERGQELAIMVLVTTAHGIDAVAEAEAALAAAAQEPSALQSSHVAAMAELWQNFDVSADDPFLERKLRACMYYLMSTWREDVVWGGSAAGLSQSAWGGSVFWDTELYMYPPMLMFHPSLARNILRYRSERLDAARENARANAEQGARFPWESRRSGRVVSPMFDSERHIGPDIAVAAWCYGHTAGDEGFMREQGWPMIVEIARHCASMTSLNKHTDHYEIHGVIPPDEHVLDHHVGTPINNSVMTNFYCAWTLKVAAEQAPDRLLDETERRHWRQIAEKMYYPRDEVRQLYLEYDGYNGHPIKQADVGHLFFPLRITEDAAEIRRNVNYYADRERETGLHLTHSPSVYGIGLARAGDRDGVLRHLLLAERTFTGPFEVPRESNYATGPVITGAGGYLNLVLFGLLGIDTMGETLCARPCLPASIGRISIDGVHFRGQRYRVTAEPGLDHATITRLD